MDHETKEVLAECYGSTEVGAKVLFPNRFSLPFSWMHRKVFSVLDDPTKQQVVIAANRGFGKTSILLLAYIAKRILFQDCNFLVPISFSSTQAVLQSDNLKKELVSNSMVNKLFGPQKSGNWSKEMWETTSGTLVLPRGAGQQVRGILHGDHRPDVILCDDIEDRDEVKSVDRRKDKKKWFYSDVVNSVDRSKNNWRIILLGTLLHEDSLLAELLDDPDWYSIRLELFNNEMKSNWPEFMSNTAIEKLVESYRRKGQLATLYKEYRNMPVPEEDASFNQEYFHYHEEGRISRNPNLQTVILCDPAKTLNQDSDETAIIGVGVIPSEKSIFVREIVSKKMRPDTIYDEIFGMATRLNATAIGYEVTSLHEFISYPMRNEMFLRNLNFELVELHAHGKKEERIASLVPFYRQGLVSHNRSSCNGLEAQLLAHPNSKRDDISDAFAYIVPMCEAGGRFFYGTDEPDDEEKDEMTQMEEEDEIYYKDLERGEDEFMTGWRVA